MSQVYSYHCKGGRERENADTFHAMRWFPWLNRIYTISAVPIFAFLGIIFAGHVVNDKVTTWCNVGINVLFIVFTCVHCRVWNGLTAP